MIFMIKITDLAGVEHNINLDYVVRVDLPSGANLNELVTMVRGDSIRLVAGTWEDAIVTLFAQYTEVPIPKANVTDKVFIVT